MPTTIVGSVIVSTPPALVVRPVFCTTNTPVVALKTLQPQPEIDASSDPVLFFRAGVVIVPLPAVVPVPVAVGTVIETADGAPVPVPFVAPLVPVAVAAGAISDIDDGAPVPVPLVAPLVPVAVAVGTVIETTDGAPVPVPLVLPPDTTSQAPIVGVAALV